ncbi:MAG: LamG domain-containing protein [Kiritimatiellae bacterium]|nr:LamG domain-containing protein [Kiritimatiellia bacterium]
MMGVCRMMGLFAFSAAAGATFDLEWNPRWRTDVPYEVELQPAKFAQLDGVSKDGGYEVLADGQMVDTRLLSGKAPGAKLLRFQVPAGTKELACRTTAHVKESNVPTENLFAGVLSSVDGWQKPGEVIGSAVASGLRFAVQKAGNPAITCTVDVPHGLTAAGRAVPMKIEVDLKSEATMTWGGIVQFEQVDGAGNVLPETLSDKRWTSHLLPPNVPVAYRENGWLHPKARKLRVVFKPAANDRVVDEYGMPRLPGPDALPQFTVSHIAVRAAANLAITPRDPSFFAGGISGDEGDRALVLGPERGFWYVTRGNGSWAGGEQYRNEDEIFFPVGAGTVEAWFKPEWTTTDTSTYWLFEGSSYGVKQRPDAVEMKGRGELFAVTYSPASGTLSFFRKDRKDKVFKGEGTAAIPAGSWTHVACTFSPGGVARVYVNGRQALETSLAGFVAMDLAKEALPNNLDVVSAYLGAEFASASTQTDPVPGKPLFSGAVDLWRVSRVVRYTDDFEPAKHFAVDAATCALFDFDDTMDGVSGGGVGFVPGTIRAEKWSRARALVVDGKPWNYYPEQILPENNPDLVLNKLNYPTLPSEAEFLAARRSLQRTFRVAGNGDFATFELKGPVYPDYVEIVNSGAKPLVYPIVLNRGDLDARSFGDFSDSLLAQKLSDRDRVNKVFNFLLKSCDYFINDTAFYEPNCNSPESVQNKALAMINGYCGFECGPLNTIACHLFACAAKCPASMTGGYGHLFQQVFFEGKNHIYDLSAQKFFPWWDNETSAYLEEDAAEPGIHNRLKGAASHFIRHGTRHVWTSDPSYREKVGISLNPGERFRAWYDNAGYNNDLYCTPRVDQWLKQKTRNFLPHELVGKACRADDRKAKLRRFERFFPQAANGFLEFDGVPAKGNPAFRDTADGQGFVYPVLSGYPIVGASYRATLGDGHVATCDYSFDGGKSWVDIPDAELDLAVRARQGYHVRVRAPREKVDRFTARTILQLNARVFPGRVQAGTNSYRFKSVSGSEAEVTIAWRENAQRMGCAEAVYTGVIPGVERATVVLDPKMPLRVAVEGLSAAAEVAAGKGLAARLVDNAQGLEISVAEQTAGPFVSYVTVKDRGAEKAFTVVACANARWVPATAAKLTGGAKLLPTAEGRVQPCAFIKGLGAQATFSFPALPPGKYAVFNVNRFASGISLSTKLHVLVPDNPQKVIGAEASNWMINYFKAQCGLPGGRAAFKWDLARDPKTDRPFWGICAFDCPHGLDHVDFTTAKYAPEGGVELAGALVMPWPEQADFRRDLMKVLCGVNCAPDRVR